MDGKQVTRNALQRPAWRTLAEFRLSGESSIEGAAARQISRILDQLRVPPKAAAQINTAVAQAAREVAERGGASAPPPRLSIRVAGLRFGDNRAGNPRTGQRAKRATEPALPESCPDDQCWGFFLVSRTANTSTTNGGHGDYTIELFLYPEGSQFGEKIF